MREKTLKVITVIATIIFLLSLCSMDSQSNIPFITGMISGVWIALITVANN